MTKQYYGAIKGLPDYRDHIWQPTITRDVLPTIVSHQSNLPPITDQGKTNNCVNSALAPYVEYKRKVLGLPQFSISRMYGYHNCLVYEAQSRPNRSISDNGCQVRDAIYLSDKQGYCHEQLWSSNKLYSQSPDQPSHFDGAHYKVWSYSRLDTLRDASGLLIPLNILKQCIAEGDCFIFAFSVYGSISPDNNGVIPTPIFNANSVTFGHSCLCIGYDDTKQAFLIRNSYGPNWNGKFKGCFYINYNHMINPLLCYDMWTIDALHDIPWNPTTDKDILVGKI